MELICARRTNCSSSYYIKFLLLLQASPRIRNSAWWLSMLVRICSVKNVAWELRSGPAGRRLDGTLITALRSRSSPPPPHWSLTLFRGPLLSPLLCQSWDVTTKVRWGEVRLAQLCPSYDVGVIRDRQQRVIYNGCVPIYYRWINHLVFIILQY